MKKFLMLCLLGGITLCLCGCEEYSESNSQEAETHNGKCLEYETQYKLDCGFFVDPDSFCKERKYDVCVRWED